MLIKRFTTAVTEESLEVKMPLYLKEKAFPGFVKLTEKGAIKVSNKCLIYFDKYRDNPDKEISNFLNDYDPCTEEEFFENYNQALATIQSHLMEMIKDALQS